MMEKTSLPKERQREICTSCGFPHIVIFLAFWGNLWHFILRVNFNVALVDMVKSPQQISAMELHNESCSGQTAIDKLNQTTLMEEHTSNYSTLLFGEKYDWDLETQSFMLSAILYGCTIAQFLGGYLSQRCGIRWVLGLSTLICSALCLLTPLAAKWGPTAVMIVRFTQGLLQGCVTPSLMQTLTTWLPVTERSRAFGFIFVGCLLGVFAGLLISGVLAGSESLGGWPSAFYVPGAVGCLWSVLWMALVYDFPEKHPCVSRRELEQIQVGHSKNQTNATTIPWKQIITSLPMWSHTLGIVGHYLAFIVLMTELPTYLTNVLHFNIKSSGALSGAPYLAQALMIVASGYVMDALRANGRLSITAICKIMTTIGFFGSALCLIGIAFVGCHQTVIVILLCVSMELIGMVSIGCYSVPVDMCPTFSATVSGISGTFGFLAAAVMPYIVTLLVSSGQTVENWSMVFIVCSVIFIAMGVQFLFFGSAERQPWDPIKPSGPEGFRNEAMETGQSKKEEITRF